MITLNLTVTEHRQSGHRGHHNGNAKILVVLAKLSYGGFLVGIVHKVDKTFEDLRVKLEGIFNALAILGVFLLHHHVHEGTVVNAVHPERADKVAFHHPERFSQQQGVRHFLGNAVNDLTPKFLRNVFVQLCRRHRAVLSPTRHAATFARFRKPDALNVLFSQRHRRVKADDREFTRHVQNRLDDRLAHLAA